MLALRSAGAAQPFFSANSSTAFWFNRSAEPLHGLTDFLAAGFGFAYDPAGGFVMKVAGGQTPGFAATGTWALTGLNWTNLSVDPSPTPRVFTSMTWDYADGCMLVFGGIWQATSMSPFVVRSDTWAYQSGNWTVVSPATGPSGRYAAALAYDPALGGVLLFGGQNESSPLNDSWLYRGGVWTEETGWSAPPPSAGAMMAWDNASGSMVLFGGVVSSVNSTEVPTNTTWSLSSTGWVPVSIAGAAPPARYLGLLTNDSSPGELLLTGGTNASYRALNDTWTYQSGTWTLHSGAGAPAMGWGDGAYDPETGAVVTELPAFSTHVDQLGGQTWDYRSGSWTLQELVSFPGPLIAPAVDTDPPLGGVLLVGGANSSLGFPNGTWLYRENLWTNIAPTGGPPARLGALLVFDPALGGDVLFGGAGPSGYMNDTWLFRNDAWSLLPEMYSPSARGGEAGAYDPATQDLVLFGGDNATTVFGDTWILNASGQWSVSAALGPAPRSAGGMADDPGAGALLLFGGSNSTSATSGGAQFNDTWEWSEGSWIREHPGRSPAARSGFGLVLDPPLGMDVLFAGGNNTTPFSDTWEFVSGDWVESSPSANPGALGTPGLAFDPSSGTVFDFGGLGVSYNPPGLLIYATGWFFDPIAVTVSASTTSGTAPVAVQFGATVRGGAPALTGSWAFGDGESSTAWNGTHVYYSSGTFPATFSLSDGFGATASASIGETIGGTGVAPLTTGLTASASNGTAPFPVTLTAAPSGGSAPYSFAWVLGDGATASTVEVNHTYSVAGNFTVLLQVTDSLGGTADAEVVIHVVAAGSHPLTLTLAVSSTRGTVPFNVTFTGTAAGGYPPYTFGWEFGDGASGAGASTAHTYQSAGNFTVTLTVTEANGATGTMTTLVHVAANTSVPPNSNTTVPPPVGPSGSPWPGWLLLLALGVVVAAAVAATVLLVRRRRPPAAGASGPVAAWEERATDDGSPIED